MNIWLMDEQPVVVDRGLARIIGFSEAVVITQLHQWIEYNKKHKKNYKDGYYWTYGSMKQWHEEYFDILGSVKTLRRVFKTLAEKGYLIVSNYNKIQRIIVNLIGNAFKYSPSGTKIEIVAKIKNQELSISIIDEGCGIKEEEIDNIFKRLYRVEASRNMKTGGYGLGLAIAKQLAMQLNGDIIVESEYGKGSTFTLEILTK